MTYPQNLSLTINPKPTPQISRLLEMYFWTIEEAIRRDNEDLTNLWVYDKKQQKIITNDSDQSVSVEFRDWLIQIDSWLRNYGYSLEGNFYYRNDTYFETLLFNPKSDIIHSFVLPQIGPDIMADKEKVDQIIMTKTPHHWSHQIYYTVVKSVRKLIDRIESVIELPRLSDGLFDVVIDPEAESVIWGVLIAVAYRVYKLFI